jgi:hypothetical protein
MQKYTTYSSINEIIMHNRETGGHFFSPFAKRFFGSRIGSVVIGGRYFITSEQERHDTSRRYTIRECVNGRINDASEFQAYATGAEARAAAYKLAAANMGAAA